MSQVHLCGRIKNGHRERQTVKMQKLVSKCAAVNEKRASMTFCLRVRSFVKLGGQKTVTEQELLFDES